MMPDDRFTVLDEGRASVVATAVREGRVFLAEPDLKAVLGWELKPEGLCRGKVCIPTTGTELMTDNGVDLVALADMLDRPIIVDFDEQAAYLGAAASERASALASLEAPDFTLPDLHGRPHSLSDYRGQKILLAAYASW
jgi:hypothetical protein